jgi:phenylpyruvate tautomerase PptA (4-oxalocrotonate tautomerase family)
MPLVEVKIPLGTLSAERKEQLHQDLVHTVAKWEGLLDPGDPRAVQATWTYIYELPTGVYPAGTPLRTLVDVSVPQDVLGEERKQGLVEEVTRAVYRAYEETDPGSAGRVYCLIHEISHGHWGFDGRTPHLRDVLPTLGLDPASTRYKELEEALRRR